MGFSSSSRIGFAAIFLKLDFMKLLRIVNLDAE